MLPIRVRLEPTRDTTHTTLRLALELPRALESWELMDLAGLLRAWTRRRTRVVLSADAPVAWFDDWGPGLAEADVEVEFTWPKRGRRRDR